MKTAIISALLLVGSVFTAGVATAAPCAEGHQQNFIETTSSISDRARVVTHTCVNGSYYAKTAAAPAMNCVDGHVQMFLEITDTNGEKMSQVFRTCRDGRYYPRTGPVVRTVCKEGSQQIFIEPNTEGKGKPVWYTCTNGKYKKTF